MNHLIYICCLTILLASTLAQNPLTTHFQWKSMDFVFPDNAEREAAVNQNRFFFPNCTPIDVDAHYGASGIPKVFVTFPRLGGGIPVTLGTVSRIGSANGLLIEPYPDYSWHRSQGANCDEMTSIFRVNVDICDRIWILDTGRVGSQRRCPPQLLVFDLRTDKLYHRYKFPRSQYVDATLLVTPVVDVLDPRPEGNCQNNRVYMADTGDNSILVYDSQQDRSWRVKHSSFRPTPGFTTFTIENESFEFTGGTFGLAFLRNLGPGRYEPDNRLLYYHSFSSPFENSVPLRILNNGEVFSRNENANANHFRQIGRRQAQSAAQAMDSNGIVYFGSMTPSAIVAWDSSLPYRNENFRIVARDRDQLQFASGVKIVHNVNGQEELWVLTNRFQKRFAARYNWNEINFRILGIPINQLRNPQSNFGPSSGPGIAFPGPVGPPFVGSDPTNFFPQGFGGQPFGPHHALDIFNRSVNNVLSQFGGGFPGGGFGGGFPQFPGGYH